MDIRWAIIFGGAILGAIASIFFLWSRFCKFAIVRKIAKDRKWLRRLLGLIPMAVFGVFAWMNVVNTAIVMIHMSIYWFIAELIGKIVKKIINKRKSGLHEESKNIDSGKFRPYLTGIIVLCFEICYFSVGWYQAHHVWRTEYTLKTDKDLGIDNLKVAMFADSHVGALFDGEGFAERLKVIQEENPDILLIPGDFVDDDTTRADMIACCQALKDFKCRYGVYMVYGNHDKGYYRYRDFTVDELVAELENAGVILLEDGAVLIDDMFYIIGRQDYSVQNRMQIRDIVSELDQSKYMIVLDHQPTAYAEESETGVDLVVSGHTHGGQLLEMNIAAYFMKANDRTYGTEKRDNTTFIVTSGIADWAIKFKTGTFSEYCIINVTGKL